LNKKPAEGPKLSKREQLRKERQQRSLIWNSILLGGGGLTIAAIVWYFVTTAQPGPLSGEFTVPNEGAGHTTSVDTPLTFQHYPPSSGAHYPAPANWNAYDDPVSEGYFVHNLEHGGVVFLYKCPENNCPELKQQFKDLFAKAPPESRFNKVKILSSPYDEAKMPSQIVALAWGNQVNLDHFDEAALLQWYQRYVNRGPELVP